MDSARRLELGSSLRGRLEAQGEGRLPWLAGQVENYVERWAAFCELTQPPAAGRVHGDLFEVIEIGAALFSEELARMPVTATPLQSAWRRFIDTLARVRVHDASVTVAQLRRDFANAMAALIAQAPPESAPTPENIGGDPS